MEFDTDKIDDDVLALLYLTAFQEKKDFPWRTWKNHDWEVMDRLFGKGYISNPKSKAKSVTLSDVGYAKAKQLFEEKYARKG
jgi:hypothetical protein